MRRRRTRLLCGRLLMVLVLGLVGIAPDPVGAQATRSWVSGEGSDADPCSRTAPCLTFAGALSKTAAGGEISAIDAGAYGAVTITKSISIVAGEQTAAILASGANGITVNAGANDVVTLRGLDIEGLGTGQNGIRFLAGRALHIENTSIRGFRGGNGRGVDVQLGATGELYLTDVEISNSTVGVHVESTGGGGPVRVSLENVRLTSNMIGLDAFDGAEVSVRNSVATGNTTAGFRVQATQSAAKLSLESSMAVFNGAGVIAGSSNGPPVRVVLSSSLVLENSGGNIAAGDTVTVTSSGDNRLDEAPTALTPTPTPTLTPGPTLTPTATPTLLPVPACTPRPQVMVSTEQNGSGQIRATVRVTTNPSGAQNTLQSISFGPATNARIDVPNGPGNSTGNVNAPQPANTTEVSFNVRRESAGAFTAPFTVVDACGGWPSFVGGGAGVP